jgi:DNA-binding NtrC family response regulator
MAAKRSHPVVQAFVSSELPIAEILRDLPGRPDEPTLALRAMEVPGWDPGPSPESLRAAESAYRQISDVNFAVLFLARWHFLALNAGRLAEGVGIIGRLRAMADAELRPEVRAVALDAESYFLRWSGGNWVRSLELSRQAVDLLPTDSPRRAGFLAELNILLAFLGRQAEADAELQAALRGAGPIALRQASVARFMQCMETGRDQDAAAHLPAVEAEQDRDPRKFLMLYQSLYELLSGRWAPRRRGADSGAGDPAAAGLPPWAAVADHLLFGRPEMAAQAVRPAVEQQAEFFLNGNGFDDHNLIRVKLAVGDGEGARRLIEMRRRRGNTSYWDDFFLARVELLPRDLLTLCRAAAGGPQPAAAAPADRPPPSPEPIGLERLVGQSPAAEAVRETVRRYAALDAPVLITGETGTGKELVAQVLHALGPRRESPFIAVNCGTIAESLLESELFGHERGAFTGAVSARHGLFEEAGRGTIFLDEIGDISPRLQVALLRVLDSGEIRRVGSSRTRKVSCRVMAATNSDLNTLLAKGLFRKDLLFRLRRLEIHLPPLRERPEDVLPLADHFLREGRPAGSRPNMSAGLKDALLRHAWPGNVRELRNAVERIRLLSSDPQRYDLAALGSSLRTLSVPGLRPSAARPEEVPAGPGPAGDRVPAVAGQDRNSRRRLARLRQLFRESREFGHGEVARILGVSAGTATRDLNVLFAEGFITRVKPNRSRRTHYYVLNEAGTRPAQPPPGRTAAD